MKKKFFFLSFNYFFIFLFFFLLIYTFYRAEIVHNSQQIDYYLKYYIIFSSSFLFWLVVLRLKIEIKIFFVILGISILFSLYAFELIRFYNISIKNIFLEKNIELPLKSEKLILIEKLIKKDKNTFPSITPSVFLDKDQMELFPLSGVSNATTVFCKEGPEFSIYKSDRYGFNNPDDNWDNKVDYLFIGDSFAQGACVDEGKDIASQLRLLTGKKTLTLGMAGNGPLTELASLKEYVSDIKVKNIFWVYFERNDLDDLKKEKKNKVLIKYLNDNFSQQLKNKQIKIDSLIKKIILDEKKKLASNNLKGEYLKNENVFQSIIRLKIVRDKLALDRGLNFEIDPLFEKIIVHAKNFAELNKSNFYFIYLPDKESYKAHNLEKKNLYKKDEILNILKKNSINIIDIQSLLFAKEKDPISLFAERIYGHYSADTYSKIAKIIKNYLELP